METHSNPLFDVPGEILTGKGSMALLRKPGSYITPALLTLTVRRNAAADGSRTG
jgi:hypothetical protein